MIFNIIKIGTARHEGFVVNMTITVKIEDVMMQFHSKI